MRCLPNNNHLMHVHHVCVCVRSRVYCCPYKPHGLREVIITSTAVHSNGIAGACRCNCIVWMPDRSSVMCMSVRSKLYHSTCILHKPWFQRPVCDRGCMSKVSGRLVGMMYNPINVMYVHLCVHHACTCTCTCTVYFLYAYSRIHHHITIPHTHTATRTTMYMYSVFS